MTVAMIMLLRKSLYVAHVQRSSYCSLGSHPRWPSNYHAWHWTQGSRIQTRQRTMDF
jgi:hypothetical protein